MRLSGTPYVTTDRMRSIWGVMNETWEIYGALAAAIVLTVALVIFFGVAAASTL